MRAEDLVGKTVVAVRRILYVYQGAVGDEGPLELSFQDGSIALFHTSGSGGNMRVTQEPWVDPFAPPLSPDNEAYVDQYGKWTAFDLTSEPPVNAVIGRQVSAYEEVVTGEEVFALIHQLTEAESKAYEGVVTHQGVFAGYQCPPGQCLAASIGFGNVVVRILNWGLDEIHVEWHGADLTIPVQPKRG